MAEKRTEEDKLVKWMLSEHIRSLGDLGTTT